MKKLFLFAVCLLAMNFTFSQNDHIKFMGIEVNGQVSTLEQRLTTKGFYKTKDGLYKGKFAGYEVKLKLQKTVNSKTVSAISVMFGEDMTQEDLRNMAASLKEKYSSGSPFDKTEGSEIYQSGIELPEGTILLDFKEKTLSYIDKANTQKNKKESIDDL